MESCPVTTQFSCQSCKVSFEAKKEFRKHYSTEFHSYNVRLKCNGQQTLPLEKFQKIIEDREKSENPEKLRKKCEICNKEFSDQKALENHCQTKTHARKLKSVSLAKETQKHNLSKNGKNAKKHEIELNSSDLCIFCTFEATGVTTLDSHLAGCHEFVIPYKENVKDLEKFIKSAREKILGGKCLFCDRQFDAARNFNGAVYKHMEMKNHRKLKEVSKEYFREFKPHFKFTREELLDISKIINPEDEIDYLTTETGELLLENGTLLGHRDNQVYFKQGVAVDTQRRRRNALASKSYRPKGELGKVAVRMEKNQSLAAADKSLKISVKSNIIDRPKVKKIH